MAVRDVVQAAAGVGGGGEYIEDVFSTYLYTGNGSTQTITNGIDLDGEGGLVWIKYRSGSGGGSHTLYDTERGTSDAIRTDLTSAEYSSTDFTSFNSNGFTLGTNNVGNTNYYTDPYASWTFRKSPNFFDVVTWTGDGSLSRAIAHNLGSTPGFIVIKRTDTNSDWVTSFYDGPTFIGRARLNSADAFNEAAATNNGYIAAPHNADTFGTQAYGTNVSAVNASGGTYVAYLFASNAGGFGADGEQNVISCGSFTGSGGIDTVTLGYEPQWILMKNATGSSNWRLMDTMRGMSYTNLNFLDPNTSNAEGGFATGFVKPTPTGFTVEPGFFGTGATVIYIAIRRPMKTPESGTEVFAPVQYTTSPEGFITGFPVDFGIAGRANSTDKWYWQSRLQGAVTMSSASSAAEFGSGSAKFDFMNGYGTGFTTAYYSNAFKRAPGFMDVVAYTGTGSNAVVKHSLSVIPEVIITKRRDATRNWAYYTNLGASTYTAAVINDTYAPGATPASYDTALTAQPSSTDFYVGTSYDCNAPTGTYVAYLFASLPGVSKVGSYTGTGSDLNVDCGFSAGARFILIKRTDSTGDWYVWDSARGIVAGNDPYILLNSTAAEVTSTDYIDPLASGFTVTSSAPAALNASGGTYIFLAIA